MRLSQDIIFNRLSLQFQVKYFNDKRNDLKYKRPIFYDNKIDVSNYVVIINEKDIDNIIECSLALYLYIGKNTKILNWIDGTIIIFDEEISIVALFNYIQNVFDIFDDWDQTLKNICYESESFESLISCSETVINEPICLIDNSFHYVAYSKNIKFSEIMDDDHYANIDIVNDFISESDFQKLFKKHDVFLYTNYFLSEKLNMVCKNIFYNGDYVARLVILCDFEEYNYRYIMSVAEHLSIYIDKIYRKYESFNFREVALGSFKRLLYDSLNNNDINILQWKKAFEENNWMENDSLQLIQFRPNPRYKKNMYAKFFADELERKWPGCICVEFKDNLFLLVNHNKYSSFSDLSFYQNLAYLLRESLLIAGLSRIINHISQLLTAYEQTSIALSLDMTTAPTFWYYKFDDYALIHMVKNCKGSFSNDQICSEKILELKNYDEEKNTEYFKTLKTYLECRLNASAAAKKLFIHRSSFLNRMDKIIELTNIDLNKNNELLYLMLSYKLLEMN